MRVAILSVLAAGAMTVSAVAQEAPAPVEPAMPEVAQPTMPEAAPPPVLPQDAPVAPTDAAAPAAPAAPVVIVPAAPEPPPPPPPAPTDATAILFHNQLEKLCMPLVRGGDISKLAPALGFKKKRGNNYELQWAKGYKAFVSDPGNNPRVCTVLIQHPVDGLIPTIDDLHGWAIYRNWTLEENAKRTTDMERSTRKWEFNTPTSREVIVLLTTRKADGSPINKNYDQTELIYTFIPY
jgi:hypothetical protein